MALVEEAEGEFPGNCSVSYLSFVYGRSLWVELNGGENSLHWQANMLPLLSIMTLWFEHVLAMCYDIGLLSNEIGIQGKNEARQLVQQLRQYYY